MSFIKTIASFVSLYLLGLAFMYIMPATFDLFWTAVMGFWDGLIITIGADVRTELSIVVLIITFFGTMGLIEESDD